MLEVLCLGWLGGNKLDQADGGGDANGDQRPEGEAPAEGEAESGAGRDAEDVCQREAGEHQCDGLRALRLGHDVRSEYGGDAEERRRGKGR